MNSSSLYQPATRYSLLGTAVKVTSLPIRAVVVLEQAKENQAERMQPTAAVRALLSQISLQKWNRQDIRLAMDITERLIERLPIYHLACLPDETAVDCLEKTLKGESHNGKRR